MTELLELEQVCAGYAEGIALDGCSFALAEGETLAVLGRNGAGKSTLLLTVMGQTRVRSGRMRWRGEDLVHVPRHRRAARGLGWVPQEREIFDSLSVQENLTVAARPGRWDLARVYELFPRLHERSRHWGNELSGGEQQMLAIARALMLNPRLLLLDEPLEGLAPVIVEEVCAGIERMVAREGQVLVLVEQHVQQALALTQRCIVLERGRLVHAAGSAELAEDPGRLERWLAVRQKLEGEPA